jgi:hypothetical protein
LIFVNVTFRKFFHLENLNFDLKIFLKALKKQYLTEQTTELFMKLNKKKMFRSLVVGAMLLTINYTHAQCPAPTPATASPSIICSGASSTLNATAVGSSIYWYTVAVGGVPIGTTVSGANLSVSPVNTTTYYAETVQSGPKTFNFTGSLQSYTVPAGVFQLTIEARGSQGGNSPGNTALGGLGARMIGTHTVIPGQVLNIVVGRQGFTKLNNGGTNYGGGGGGASWVWTNSVNPIVVAGAGGGAFNNIAGGNGTISTSGNASSAGGFGGTAGNGGDGWWDWTSGGGGGGWYTPGGDSFGYGPTILQGGGTYSTFVAGLCTSPCTASPTNYGIDGGYGGGGACWHAGGGGGGYSGGGGGAWGQGNGGGGGSYSSGFVQMNSSGFQSGNGLVIIVTPSCTSASRTAVEVLVATHPTVTVNSGSICPESSFTIVPSGANTYTFEGGSAVVSPTSNATYTVIGTSTAGCISQSVAVSSVTVDAAPLPTISVNNGSICSGNSFTIIPSGANSYTFEGGSAVVSPTANTNFTVVGSNTAGCVSQTFATSSVVVSPLPILSVSANATICLGESTILTAGGTDTYSWNTGANTESITVSPTVTSSYSVVGTSSATGCSDYSSINIVVDPCTGLVIKPGSNNTLLLFPNPNNGDFVIETASAERKTVEVSDLSGRVVFSKTYNEEKIHLQLRFLTNGVYMIKVKDANSQQLLKLIMQ